MIKNRLLSAAVFAAIVLPTSAMATNGYFMMGNGTKANGRAGVGIGMADSAISGADNPAAMVRVGNRFDFGIQVFSPDREAEIINNPLFNYNDNGNNDGPFYIPEGGFNYMLSDDMSIGLSVVGTGDMNTNYDNLALFNFTLMPVVSTTGINLEQVRILPTLSYMINDKHSVGVSLQIAYQEFKAWGLSNFTATGIPGQLSQAPDKLSKNTRDNAWGFGLSLGWQGQLTDQLTVGMTYNSEVDMDEFDDYRGLFAEDGSLDIPENYGIGIAFQANDQLLLAFDVQQINYSDVDSIANPLQSGQCGFGISGGCLSVPANYLGTDNGSGFGWDDMTVYKLGIEYQWNKELTLRAGYSHADQPIDKDQTMFNILAPAVEDHATIGMTYVLPNQSEISMFYMHAFEEEVKGSNSIPDAFVGGDANIKMSQDAFGVAYGWDF
ncbi:MAG: TonB-dependent receptor [gamma proteobacterium symbiont of Bathyaustriella thionipta]|nr:TonB-dependent receptor [gamma proteobacterium symbiont of Bathyaustriella thionipta]MCU7949909.1 TonB-dependent receptor [gamma proteobacterium symbiont of Bathyaustriella thionipta]MCU7953473.1 TonB-dependent receptor [gamma proteobacterium symbiont of Bathyaustriella thionipta]MCU7955578.1 TonB-dependent receptor [gamma proteobacterium symbiont of Bathyaustriella thionipta]MCU7965878.1 TonB-dependent receptor [gamma proteobacterium symbiont of Bathyaustriella thionipta]